MLRELHITNLAVIADARIEFEAGLNCFTGATGAGKSLVIGAIELLLGLRSAAEMLRPGTDEGRVSGVFDIQNKRLLEEIETVLDIPLTSDGGELLLVRKLQASGRTSVSVNGHPITLGMLKNLADRLIDVHGQHDHQYLLKPANQIDVLDAFAETGELRGKYHSVFQEWTEARRQIENLSASRTLRQQQLELYRFQAGEIDAAELQPAEYEELKSRASVLTNLEKLKKEAAAAHANLYEADGSILERLKMTTGVLAELAQLDFNLKPVADTVRDATVQLEDSAFDLGRYLDRLDLDPAELTEVNDRLNVINRILNKYGDPLAIALDYRQEIGQKISDLERATDDLTSIQVRLDPLFEEIQRLGGQLSRQRTAAGKALAGRIEKALSELGMEKARFSVTITPTSEPLASGLDAVEFIAQTNPGQLAQPLRKIASGGELSRVMLALKGILAQSDRISVLVFDEIDANVGGRLGSVIGDKLRELARHHQVLCITHLPQIASYADRHFTVRKIVVGKETLTSVRVMSGDERIEELAEMIGGQRITETTRAQARELLDSATGHAGEKRPRSVTAGKPGRSK